MSLERDGFSLAPSGLAPEQLAELADALESESLDGVSRRGGATYARRNLATRPAVVALSRRLAPVGLKLVRAILFDKRPEANWPVPWHQDLSLAVSERAELPGWGPWSVKSGVVHVQPPAEYLEKMLALRLHLDDCPTENGALKVLPGTHLLGRLGATRVQELRTTVPETLCPARAGEVLAMRPLLLHASSPAEIPTRRRVLHLELAPPDLLPAPLRWAAENP